MRHAMPWPIDKAVGLLSDAIEVQAECLNKTAKRLPRPALQFLPQQKRSMSYFAWKNHVLCSGLQEAS